MLNVVKLSGVVKVRKSEPRTNDKKETLYSVLLNVVTDYNGQGVQYVSCNYISKNETPFEDGSYYQLKGFIKTWSKADKQGKKTFGQNIQIQTFEKLSKDVVRERKNMMEEYNESILSGSLD